MALDRAHEFLSKELEVPGEVAESFSIESQYVQRFVGDAAAAAGRVDILVNNAVTSMSAPFDEQTDAHWQYHINVKLMAYIRCAREVLPHMQARGWGRIVNIGGMTARITAPLRITNGIVNAGVANFTKQFSGHVAPHNITVNCVHPGSTVAFGNRDAEQPQVSKLAE